MMASKVSEYVPHDIGISYFKHKELYKIFSGNKPCQLWIKAQRFGDHLRLHHQGNDVKVDRW
jgi:hypothetical protein